MIIEIENKVPGLTRSGF
uniref:Uncharacterized protein n=1 Tax=Anguilla anguilla TaxID=7936 RepID=A0A0E9XLE5_ANGAN